MSKPSLPPLPFHIPLPPNNNPISLPPTALPINPTSPKPKRHHTRIISQVGVREEMRVEQEEGNKRLVEEIQRAMDRGRVRGERERVTT